MQDSARLALAAKRQTGEVEACLAIARAAFESDADPEARSQYAFYLNAVGREQEALALLTEQYANSPEDAILRIIALIGLGETDKARRELEASFAKYPANEEVSALRHYMHLKELESGEAFDSLERASHHGLASASVYLLNYWCLKRDLPHAKQILENRVKTKSVTYLAVRPYLELLIDVGMLVEALELIDELDASRAPASEFAYARTVVLAKMRRYREAIDAIRPLVAARPGEVRYYRIFSRCLLRLGRFRQLFAAMRTYGSNLDPDLALARIKRACRGLHDPSAMR